ncbi:MAG: hypothetical protein WB791_02065 [Waddliaceae bacterium]
MVAINTDYQRSVNTRQMKMENDPFHMDIREFRAIENQPPADAIGPTIIPVTAATISVTKYVVTIAAAC